MNMTDNVDINAPIAWKVSGRLPTEKVSGFKDAIEESTFDTADKANAYKLVLQSQGWIATVTPVFLNSRERNKIRATRQARTVPLKFNEDWRTMK